MNTSNPMQRPGPRIHAVIQRDPDERLRDAGWTTTAKSASELARSNTLRRKPGIGSKARPSPTGPTGETASIKYNCIK